MGSQRTYSGISTKIRSMRSRLLTDKDYENLAQLSSVAEAVEFLRQKPGFREAFASLDERTMHRSVIEGLLFYSEYYDFVKIYRFSGFEVRRFLDVYFPGFERSYLKSAIRAVVDHRESDIQIKSLGSFFEKHASFDCVRLSEAKTLDEFVAALQNSPFYPYLHPLLGQSGVTLFDYEMAMDYCVFGNMWRQYKKHFDKEATQTLCRSYGCQFDLTNLMWIYRSKKYYEMDKTDIYKVLLPIHYKLNKTVIKNMVEAGSNEEFLDLMRNTYYGTKYVVNLEREEDGFYIEQIYHALLSHIHNREFRNHPFSVASASAYLHMKHTETERLTTTIEGIRYGLPPQEIVAHEKKYNLEVLYK